MLVHKADGGAARDERHFAEALGQRVEAEVEVILEDLLVELEGDLGSGVLRLLQLADDLDRLLRVAAFVALEMDLAVALDLDLAPFGKRVDRRYAHAVQAAGDLVPAAAELAAGMQLGHDHFQGGFLLCRVHVHRDAAPVIDRR